MGDGSRDRKDKGVSAPPLPQPQAKLSPTEKNPVADSEKSCTRLMRLGSVLIPEGLSVGGDQRQQAQGRVMSVTVTHSRRLTDSTRQQSRKSMATVNQRTKPEATWEKLLWGEEKVGRKL